MRGSLSRARVAVTVVFALNGALFASIFSRLPAIQERAGIGDGALGLALLCSMLGLLVSQVGAGALVARVGSRSVVSVGALGGAAVGGVVAAAGVGVVAHLCTAAALGACVAVAADRFLLPRSADAAPEGPLLARPTRALAAIGVFAFCALLSEGAVNDWVAVYLEDDLDTSEGLAAGGLAAFSLTMGIGRLAGDRLTEALGPARLARAGGGLPAG